MPIRPALLHRFSCALLFACCTLVFAAPEAPQKKYEDLSVYGEVLPNACTPMAKKKQRAALDAAKVSAPDQAWKVITTLLCAENSASQQRYVQSILANKVHSNEEATGSEPEITTLKPSRELANSLLASGRAWDAKLEMRGDAFTLNYYSDEASIKGLTIKLVNAKWTVIAIDGATD